MKPSLTVLVLLCLIVLAGAIVWICLYFAKRHVEKKSAMSKAYYHRAREGIPNNTDVELGPQSKNPYNVRLAPYRYMSRNKEVNKVRPNRAARVGHANGKLQGTDVHVHHNPSSRRGAHPIHENGFNHHHHHIQQQQQSARQSKKQRQRQKRKNESRGGHQRQDERHEQETPEQRTDNAWNQGPGHDSRHSNQGWSSHRGSHAGTEYHGHDDDHNNNNDNNEQGGYGGGWNNDHHDDNHGQQDTGDWNQNVEEEHRSNHHGSANMPGGWETGWEALPGHNNEDHGNAGSQMW
ncbi:hypothetical protein PENSTE_c006G05639 [Penicillium steckii]|uniref:Uncharacterized protein n=1 Tax=Penicillium steckii TaxID=303698 RepID=A0A1V6TGA2_9EURO|nr:hypothetical protein PENSTE_c006G05639 [Penicillium steckii]